MTDTVAPTPRVHWHAIALATLKGQYFAMVEREGNEPSVNKRAELKIAIDGLEQAVRILTHNLCERCWTQCKHLHYEDGHLWCHSCYMRERVDS